MTASTDSKPATREPGACDGEDIGRGEPGANDKAAAGAAAGAAAQAKPPLTRSLILKIAAALAIGIAGAEVFRLAALPLPWMLGPMCACTLAVLAGLPLGSPQRIRTPMVVVLGVLLGSGFSPEVAGRLDEWLASLVLLLVSLITAGLAAVLYFRLVARYDLVTAYFSGMPGGLNEMITVGGAFGGDERQISLSHGTRILFVVLLLPFAFEFLAGAAIGARPPVAPSILETPPFDLLSLAACGVVGWYGARLLRIPAGPLIGPMTVSAIVHLAGFTDSKPPAELVAAAQLVIGTAIGCRFLGADRREVLRSIAYGIGLATVMLLTVALVAWIGAPLVGVPFPILMLAMAPGGLAEMSLIALALHADVPYVATMHMIRIVIVILAAPLVFRIFSPRRRGRDAQDR